jgi:hypothetical protein
MNIFRKPGLPFMQVLMNSFDVHRVSSKIAQLYQGDCGRSKKQKAKLAIKGGKDPFQFSVGSPIGSYDL